MAREFFTIEDGKAHLWAHRYQVRTAESLAQEIIDLKGWQGGYTTPVPWWLLKEMARCGPGNPALTYLGLVPVVAGARMLVDTQRVFETHLGIADLVKTPRPKFVINERGEQMLWGHRQREKTEIQFYPAADPNSFAQLSVLAAVCDELTMVNFKKESWDVLQSRVTTTRNRMGTDDRPCGRILAGSTVYRLGHVQDMYNEYVAAIYKAWRETPRSDPEARREFWERYRKGLIFPKRHFIRFASDKNPAFGREQMQAARERMPLWWWQMRHRAMFVKPAGMIFDGWNQGRHVVESFELPARWPRWCAIDPGKRNFHALIIAHDDERDRHFIYGAYHDAQKSNQQRAEEIRAKWPEIEQCVAGQISEDDVRAELARGGLPAQAPLFKELWLGINGVAAAIWLNKVFIFAGVCGGFEDQVRSYTRPVDEYGNVDLDGDPEEKAAYHWIDPLRYYGTFKFNGLQDSGAPVTGGAAGFERTAAPAGRDAPMVGSDMPLLAGAMEAPMFGGGSAGGGELPWLDM